MKKIRLASAALAMALCACGGSSKNANSPGGSADCEKLIPHVIELTVAAKPAADQAEVRTKLEANRGAMVDNCRSQIKPTQGQYNCMMAAPDSATLNACK